MSLFGPDEEDGIPLPELGKGDVWTRFAVHTSNAVRPVERQPGMLSAMIDSVVPGVIAGGRKFGQDMYTALAGGLPPTPKQAAKMAGRATPPDGPEGVADAGEAYVQRMQRAVRPENRQEVTVDAFLQDQKDALTLPYDLATGRATIYDPDFAKRLMNLVGLTTMVAGPTAKAGSAALKSMGTRFGAGAIARTQAAAGRGIQSIIRSRGDSVPSETVFGKHIVDSNSEQIPGRATGLLPDLLDAEYKTKEAFSNRAPWTNTHGQDMTYRDIGMDVRKSESGPGHYINSAGEPEINPVTVGKPVVSYRLVDGAPEISAADRAAVKAVEAVRGLGDMQEGSAAHAVFTDATNGGPWAVKLDMGRMPSADEMTRLSEIARRHGFDLGNADRGVHLLSRADHSMADVANMLEGGLGRELGSFAPNAKIKPGVQWTAYIDQAQNLAKENAGQGRGTREVVKHLDELNKQDAERYEKLLDSDSIAAKMQENLDRLHEWGARGQRPDYETLLKEIATGKIRGLLDRINRRGYSGLPAIGAAGVAPAFVARGAPRQID